MIRRILLIALLCLLARTAVADDACPAGKVCVDKADMPVLLEAAKEKQCLKTTAPTVTSDPIHVVIDKSGRVYGSGSSPKPFNVHLTWCNYTLDATSQMQIVAGMVAPDPPQTWGFRFRPKATLGALWGEVALGSKLTDSLDAGLLVEPFFIRWFNINAFVGFRSFGGGLGFDVTSRFGFYVGYSLTWATWHSNPFTSLYFSFW
jgi:hypothetical protein